MATPAPTTDNGRTIAAMYEAFGRGDVPFVLEQPEVCREANDLFDLIGSLLRHPR